MSKIGARITTFTASGKHGNKFLDYHNDHEQVPRDATINRLLPRAVTECAIARNGEHVCLRRPIVEKIAVGHGITPARDIEATLRALMSATGCADEKCVLTAARNKAIISAEEAGIEELLSFKQSGPTDNSLFSDSVIDAQMYAWMYEFDQFWAYNFNMRNWHEKSIRNGRVRAQPDTLATISWVDLYRGQVPDPVGMNMTPTARAMIERKRAKGIRYGACVINTDEYDGEGKHWMALFVDARDTGTTPQWSVEFFNSAAIRPKAEWLEWMAKTRAELLSINPRANVRYIYICEIWHQHSKTECGPYSLFYIWARINGIDPQYFLNTPVPDQIVFEFRQHLFNDSEEDRGKPFNFARYAQKVRVTWDKE